MQINAIPKRFNRPFVIIRKERLRNKEVTLLCCDLSNELLELNTPESVRLLELCNGRRTVTEIINMLADEVGLSVSDIKNDALKLFGVLEEYGVIFYDTTAMTI